MCNHNPLHCVIPPYIIERLTEHPDPAVRRRAIVNIEASATFRAVRAAAQAMPSLMAAVSPTGVKHRLVYDCKSTKQLPGTLMRSEGQPRVADVAVNEAYDYAGDTYDFYAKQFQRKSLDDRGMTLISSVHVGQNYDNAFWNGEQMAYGDGDGAVFQRFTRSLEVVGHELTHGVVSFTSNLDYYGQSGALNEHFADVFGVLVRQWKRNQTVAKVSWLIGADILVPAPTRRGIRDMANPGTAFRNDPDLGDDPQPGHVKQLYTGGDDNGGVHLNSGIPNRAFVLAAKALGGKAWTVAGRIWYDTMRQLTNSSEFADCAAVSRQIAASHGAKAQAAVNAAWKKVGL